MATATTTANAHRREGHRQRMTPTTYPTEHPEISSQGESGPFQEATPKSCTSGDARQRKTPSARCSNREQGDGHTRLTYDNRTRCFVFSPFLV